MHVTAECGRRVRKCDLEEGEGKDGEDENLWDVVE